MVRPKGMMKERGEEKSGYSWYQCPNCGYWYPHPSILRSIPYCEDCESPMVRREAA